MEQCTKEHWKMIPSVIEDASFDALGISKWLCPSINSIIKFKGHFTSPESIYMKLDIN